jgi:hypothetical protein
MRDATVRVPVPAGGGRRCEGFRAAGLVLVALAIVACGGDDDTTTPRIRPDDVVGDWHLEGLVTNDGCHYGAPSPDNFDWRLAATGDLLSAQDEYSCDATGLGYLEDGGVVLTVSYHTETVDGCTYTNDYREDLTFSGADRLTVVSRAVVRVSGDTCAGLGVSACEEVWEWTGERCEDCYYCPSALGAPRPGMDEGTGPLERLRPRAPRAG